MGLNLPLPIPAVYYKSHGLGRAKPWPSQSRDPWLGLEFQKAGATLGRAKATAFRPSRAGTVLIPRENWTFQGWFLVKFLVTKNWSGILIGNTLGMMKLPTLGGKVHQVMCKKQGAGQEGKKLGNSMKVKACEAICASKYG